jgi:hypothetical protein
MSSMDHPWTMAAVAGAGRSWLHALLVRKRRAWGGTYGAPAWSEDSRLGLEDRILATRTQIAAMHRSLAMQKHALDATRRAGQRITAGPWSRPANGTPTTDRPRLDVSLDEGKPSDYADTEPMSSFMDSPSFAEDPAQK